MAQSEERAVPKRRDEAVQPQPEGGREILYGLIYPHITDAHTLAT